MAAIPVPRFYLRATFLAFALIALCSIDFLYSKTHTRYQLHGIGGGVQFPLTVSNGDVGIRKVSLVAERYDLSDRLCRDYFPGLMSSVDENVKRGQFAFKRSDSDYRGLVQGRIHKNNLYILTTAPDITPEILHQRTAILSQIHRALITAPSLLPSTHFAFVINDAPKNNSWVFATPNKVSSYNTWLMPHFGFWSWAGKGQSMGLGTLDEVLGRITEVERATPWSKKVDKVVWRGTPWFNPIGNPQLRQDLVKATKSKDWADVQALNVTTQGEHSNSIPIHDFCRYRYIVYTEGVTYSGRLPYHQACASVLLTPPLTYLTHTAHMMRPIEAEKLMAAFDTDAGKGRPAFNGPPPPAPGKSPIQPLLPTVEDWRTANAIYLDPSFSNLERTILFLREHPDVASRIAANQRSLVYGRGYLSQAAETCYWRSLIRGWASVAEAEDEEGDGEDIRWGGEVGERFENWILRQVAGGKEREMQGVGARGRIVGRGPRN